MSPDEPDLTKLRAVFVAQRAARGWTYEELAERSGVSRQTLLNIASGKYVGDVRTWVKLARAFGVGLDELFSEVWEK